MFARGRTRTIENTYDPGDNLETCTGLLDEERDILLQKRLAQMTNENAFWNQHSKESLTVTQCLYGELANPSSAFCFSFDSRYVQQRDALYKKMVGLDSTEQPTRKTKEQMFG